MSDDIRSGDEWPVLSLDAPKPNIARVYDYVLGGKDNFAPDREIGDRIREAVPDVHTGVQEQRALLRRVVRHLVGEAGLKQLVDIGSGLPTAQNVHQVAQEIDPSVRVVYVDNDPVALSHARALLADNAETIVIDGDLRRPAEILADPALRAHIDLDQPVGLLLCGILHYILDEEDPLGITATLNSSLASGSQVFIHHLVSSDDPGAEVMQQAFLQGLGRGQFRTMAEVTRMFDGLELLDPGVVFVPDWRPDADTAPLSEHPVLRFAAAGVARKP